MQKFPARSNAQAGTRSSGRSVHVAPFATQLFYDPRGEFNEKESICLPCEEGHWQKLVYTPCHGRLRFDPAERPGVAEIAAIRIRSTCDGRVVWEARSAADWDALIIGGDAVRIPHERYLKLACHGNDPRLLLPEVKRLKADEPLEVTMVMRVSRSLTTNASSPDELLKAIAS